MLTQNPTHVEAVLNDQINHICVLNDKTSVYAKNIRRLHNRVLRSQKINKNNCNRYELILQKTTELEKLVKEKFG